jgi:hypothetical protein
MRMMVGTIGLALAAAALQGCVAKTVVDVAALPVKATSKTVNLATTSQSESDEKRGRELREREEKLEKLRKTYSRQLAKCQDGFRRSCDAALVTEGEIHDLAAALPASPD